MVGEGWFRGRAIGKGSTATVFLATSYGSGDVFAIKSAELSRSALLQREQSILSSLRSPAIISCLGFDVAPRDGGALLYNLFLEYAGGGSLADHIKQRGRFLDETDVRSKTHDILAGLSHLHGRGVIHCDVKPGNILLVSGGRAKIGDLGCARWLADGEQGVRGSPMYMAPEAVRGEEQGMPADIWSLGCVVIEMLTGLPPWPVVDVLESIRRIGFSKDVPEIPVWVSQEARDFLGKCLRRDPAERWTAEELLRHPFVSSSGCTELSWISSKSTLDLSLWDSTEEEDGEGEGVGFCYEEPAERIQELAVVSGDPNWAWDGEWLLIRRAHSEYPEQESAVPSVSTAGDELKVGGRWNVDETSSSSGGEDLVELEVGSVSCKFCHLEEANGSKMLRCASLGGSVRSCRRFGNGDRYPRPSSDWRFIIWISLTNLLLFFFGIGFHCKSS